MNPVHAVDPLLKEQDPHLLHLSVLLMQNGLSFSVLEPSSGMLLAEVNHPFFPGEAMDQALHRIWAADHLLQLPYNQIKASWYHPQFTLVPHAFLNDDAGRFLSVEHHVSDPVAVHPLGNDVVVIQAFPTALKKWLHTHFQKANLATWMGNWIEQESDDLALFVQEDTTSLLLKKNGELELAQVYQTPSPEDQLYYILFALEQVGTNLRETTATLSGTGVAQLTKNLADYLPHFKSAKLNGLHPAPALAALDLNWHLHSLHLCASSVAD